MNAYTYTTATQTLTAKRCWDDMAGQGQVISHHDRELGRPAQQLTVEQMDNLITFWHEHGLIDSRPR
jgi:hypothetical protein